MATIINADTSDGLKLTSDTSGQIDFQSAGSTKATIDTSGNLTLKDSSGIVDILSGTIELNGNSFNSIQVVSADDAVSELTFNGRLGGGFLSLSPDGDGTFPQSQYGYFGFLDFGNSPARGAAMYQGSSTGYNSSSALTGTTGTDGQVTVGTAGTSGTLYIENRSGVSRTFQVTLL